MIARVDVASVRKLPAARDLARTRWPLLAALPAMVILARRRRDLRLPRGFSTTLAAAAPVVVAAAIPRGRTRHVLLWSAQMWAYKIAFEIPYDRRKRLRRRLRVEAPIRADRLIGRGTTPTERLQRRLRRPDRVNALDRFFTAVYAFWEVEPHLAMAVVAARRPDRFAALAARQAATFDMTLLGYWLAPTAPPWWAAEEEGRLDGVRRVPPRVWRDLRGEPLDQDDSVGANPWAAMPSDHFAAALAAGLALVELHPAAGAADLAYAALLGAALVYLGEHYVLDLCAGCALALSIAALERPLRPVGRRVDRAWRRVEPRGLSADRRRRHGRGARVAVAAMRRPCKRLVTAVLTLFAVCAIGCSNGRVSEQDDIAGTVRTFLDQCAEQDVLRVLPMLVPAARRVVAEAGSTTRGCSRVLGAVAPIAPQQFASAREKITAFDGGRARVAVDIGGHAQSVELSRGERLWRIEAP